MNELGSCIVWIFPLGKMGKKGGIRDMYRCKVL